MTHIPIKVDVLSSDGEAKLFEYHLEKSRRPHDWHWNQAETISGAADYTYGLDEGEEPRQ